MISAVNDSTYHMSEGVISVSASAKKQPPSPKKRGFFGSIYRLLCYVGLKIQFKTYNPRRRLRRRLAPVGQRVADTWRTGVAAPVAGAFREWRQICHEISDKPKKSGKKAASPRTSFRKRLGEVRGNHKDFFAGIRNIALPLICLGLLGGVAFSVAKSSRSLQIACNGKVLGYIADETVYNDAITLLHQRLQNSSNDYQSTLSPTYAVSAVSSSMNMNAEALCEAMLADSQNVDSAYGLYIDGELCAAAKSYGDIQFILESFLDKYKTGTPGETVTFVGETQIVKGLYDAEKILSSKKFQKTISTKRTETQVYTVMQGDTAASIANLANMSYKRLMALNEDLSDTPEEGTSVLLEKDLPVLAVQTVRNVTVKEKIPFTKKTIKDNTKYTGYSKCTTKGQNGVREVVQQVTEINGKQVACEVLYSTVVKEPVEAVYVVGTKKGSKVGSGAFTWPVPGVRTISSPYGYRWGRLHRGIDISTHGIYGRTVVAADSGTVTVKRSATGYGLHIIISHGNGYSTCYAHLSAVSVKSGAVVAKGQAIAKVGNSGSSTGPHLHFEIRKNNVAGNPMNYY
ncbi:MAG: M23 family metallopeptidase [Clostridia bacterium]|nr:M23 family metallopeptidase [Clostridia bacterium]